MSKRKMDYLSLPLAERVKKELEPGMVPVWAFQIDKARAALERAAAR